MLDNNKWILQQDIEFPMHDTISIGCTLILVDIRSNNRQDTAAADGIFHPSFATLFKVSRFQVKWLEKKRKKKKKKEKKKEKKEKKRWSSIWSSI